MADRTTRGLRLLNQSEKEKKQKNALRTRLYRQKLKDNKELYELQCQKDAERNKKNRRRPRTAEEMERIRQLGRERSKRYREAKKRKQQSVPATSVARKEQPSKRQTRREAELSEEKRKYWREKKRDERKKWTSQKWRRHREAALAHYYKNRPAGFSSSTMSAAAEGQPFNSTVSFPTTSSDSPPPNPTVLEPITPQNKAPQPFNRKSANRAKQHLFKSLKPNQFGRIISWIIKQAKKSPRKAQSLDEAFVSTPSLSEKLQKKLAQLKSKRNKQSKFAKQLFMNLAGMPNTTVPSQDSHQRKSSAAKELAQSFLEDVAVNLPGKNTVIKKTGQQRKVLPKRMKRLYKEFRKTNPEHQLSLRTFYRCLPSHIHTARRQTYRQCLCEVCQNIDLILEVVNRHLTAEIDGRDVMNEMTLCTDFSPECLNRICKRCGTKQLLQHLLNNLKCPKTRILKWSSWDRVKKDKGQRKELVTHEGTMEDLISTLVQYSEPFAKHVFTHRWQHAQLKTLLADLPNDAAVALFDFAENHLCRYQDEVQSAHWGYNQVTVHPVVIYYRCKECADLVTDYQVFLSDDICHDSAMVQTILQKTKTYLHMQLPTLNRLFVFSDGCAAQYKSKLPFFFLANKSGIPTEWHYFGSRHGKSPCDACGGVVKRLIDEDVLASEVIVQSANDMFTHCCKHYTLPSDSAPESCHYIKRGFHLIVAAEIDRSIKSSSVETVTGTRNLHGVRGLGNCKIETRQFSCFCSFCLSGESLMHQCQVCRQLGIVAREAYIRHARSRTCIRCCTSTTSHDTKDVYFKTLQQQMNSCTEYEQLEQIVSDSQSFSYELPVITQQSVVSVNGCIDSTALSFLPEGSTTLYPVATIADGNCLPRALSLCAFGNQTHHQELRCRTIEEMVKHFADYIDGKGMEKEGEDPSTLIDLLCLHVENFTPGADIKTALKQEILSVKNDKSYMCVWELAAAANVLQVPIQSVYPQLGWPTSVLLNNRLLRPRKCSSLTLCHIMWTSSRTDMSKAHWVANHFVPLMPLDLPKTFSIDNPNESSENPVVGTFYRVKWNRGIYIARVLQHDQDQQTILLLFMAEKHGLFYWPTKDDLSEEHVSCLISKVTLELDEKLSSQRTQYFHALDY